MLRIVAQLNFKHKKNGSSKIDVCTGASLDEVTTLGVYSVYFAIDEAV